MFRDFDIFKEFVFVLIIWYSRRVQLVLLGVVVVCKSFLFSFENGVKSWSKTDESKVRSTVSLTTEEHHSSTAGVT